MEFELTESVCVAFSRTKEEISKNVTLPYFNPNSSITLQTDASKKGLGAVLLQNSKPVMFASRALTGSERNYQNLERECLATIWGMEKFHYFLYGKEFTLETDQKPLVSIYRNTWWKFPLHDPSSFYLLVCLFYQMDSEWHHNIYVRVPSSTGLSCMYL